MENAVRMRRSRRLEFGGTFLVAIALAMQLGQQGALADNFLMQTLPVVFLGAMLSGWPLSPYAAAMMAIALTSTVAAFGVFQSGSAHTDELMLFAIPFSVASAVVVGHVRGWSGRTAIAMSVVCAALAMGVGLTEIPMAFVIAHAAVIIALPRVPLR